MSTKKKFDIRDILISVLVALLIAIVIRSFIFEPFRIPSGSMYPTLKVGDILVVNKFSYGYSKHSLPWSVPLIKNRIFYKVPKRGDVIVVKLPDHPKRFFIKRLVGLPGDTIRLNNGSLYINEQMVERKYVGPVSAEKHVEYTKYVTEYKEELPNGKNYGTWSLEMIKNPRQFPSTTDVFTVPEDHFFFLGDNRDDSGDSRFLDGLGYIHKDNLLGRASFMMISLSKLGRMFKVIR